ncbi:MAG: hypothetical protein HFG67_02385 [Firmicutes bacterium]|nr:hypothetical protein [Bacillota bacterium]
MDYKDIIKEQLAEFDLSELEEVLDDGSIYSTFSGVSAESIINSILAGEPLFNTEAVIEGVKDLFLYEMKSALVLGVEIVTISIVIGLLKSFSSSFGEKAVSNLGTMVCTCLIIGLCLGNFTTTFNLCKNAVNTMTYTMQILLPILIPLLIAIGGVTSGSVLNPVITGATAAVNTVLSNFILPAVFISTVFFMVNSMTEKDYVNKLAVFIRGAATFLCGICVTFFAGVTVVQSFVTESADGVIADTARYSISNFVPIIGGFASDSVDMMLSCVNIIKNGVGILGVIVIIAVLLVPLIKILAIAVVYKITAIITEPLGNKQVSECLSQMGNSVITMAVILFLTSMMFLIFIAVIIGIGA